jgi:pilus assembly protein CpaF
MTTIADTAEAAWGRIIPFLRPIEPLIRDPEISDILVNGDQAVFFEKGGRLEPFTGITLREPSLQVAARNIARALGDEISEESPMLDSRLPDGSRVAIILSCIAVGGTTLAIRKFQSKRYDVQELVRVGTLPGAVLELLRAAIEKRWNLLIAGGTGAGKTTLLNALAGLIPEEERLIVIEDTSEIQVAKPNVVRLEARREQPNLPAISIRDLLRAALRLRPDRILLGEVRGSEAFDLLQALNTGHSGTLSTTHADSARETLTRFVTCVMMAGVDLPYHVVRAQIGEGLDLVIHLERRPGKRQVTEVLRVHGYNAAQDRYELESVYARV